MVDTRAYRGQITMILNQCDSEEVREVYEFCKKIKERHQSQHIYSRNKPAAAAPAVRPENITIDYLCQKIHHCNTVANWLHETYFKGKPESFEQVLLTVKICYAATFPVRLVALNEAGECVGTVSIIAEDLQDKTFVPLITFLHVVDNYLAHGVAQKLVDRCKQILRGLGYREAFIKARKGDSALGCVNDLIKNETGWELVETLNDKYNQPTQIYKSAVTVNT